MPTGEPSGAADIAVIMNAIKSTSVAQLVAVPGVPFYVDAPILVGGGQALLGGGASVYQVNPDADAVTVTGTGTLVMPRIEAVSLSGPGFGTGQGISAASSGGSSPIAHLSVRDVYILAFGGLGMDLRTVIASKLSNIGAWNCGAGGFRLTGGTSVSASALYANGCRGPGYQLNGMAYTHLDGCACDSSFLGYVLSAGVGVSLTACGAESLLAAAGYTGTAFTVSGQGHTLTSCYATNTPSHADSFWVTGGARGATLTSCLEIGPLPGAAASFRTDAGTSCLIQQPVYQTPMALAGTCEVTGGA
jgi:hypothetical protein